MVHKKQVDCLVIGDCFFDVTLKLSGYNKALVKGGAVQTSDITFLPGGSGNVAVAISRLGGISSFCGVVGNDSLGHIYTSDLKNNSVTAIVYTDRERSTGILLSLISSNGERSFVVSRGANDTFRQEYIEEAFDKINPRVVFISGYNLTDKSMEAIISHALDLAKSNDSKILFDCTPHNLVRLKKRLFSEIVSRSYCVCLNYAEALSLLGYSDLDAIVKSLTRKVKLLALKLGEKGCIIAERSKAIRIDAPSVKVKDTNGAGDSFCAAIAHGISRNMTNVQMGELGVRLSSLKVQFDGPRLPSTISLPEALRNTLPLSFENHKQRKKSYYIHRSSEGISHE